MRLDLWLLRVHLWLITFLSLKNKAFQRPELRRTSRTRRRCALFCRNLGGFWRFWPPARPGFRADRPLRRADCELRPGRFQSFSDQILARLQKLSKVFAIFGAISGPARAIFLLEHHARKSLAIRLISFPLPWVFAIVAHGSAYWIGPWAGNSDTGTSAVPSRLAVRPTLEASSSRLASSGSELIAQPIVTLATVRPILFGVAVRVRRDS